MYKLTRDDEGLFTTKLDCPVCENKYIFVEGVNGTIVDEKNDRNILEDSKEVLISAKCTECGHKEKFDGNIEL